MLNLLADLLRWLAAPAEVEDDPRDPLMHPALKEMSQRELADLPFSKDVSRSEGCGCCAA